MSARNAFLTLCAAVAANCLMAAEWYVDPVNGKDDYDGTSSNVVSSSTGPRKTLKGIMGVAGANDTVWLLPGTYDEGTMTGGSDTDRRLQVIGKAGMTFRSTGGRDRTFIDGKGTHGCVRIENSGNCRFEGITFRNGVAPIGAGLRDHTQNCWVIGCRFENCKATTLCGGMLQGCASGTEFIDCTATGAPEIAYNLYAEFCSFRNQKAMSNVAFTQSGTFVNCTIVGCRGGVFNESKFLLYNSLVFGNENANGAASNGAKAGGYLFLTNSFVGTCNGSYATTGAGSEKGVAAERMRIVAAAAGDFRLADTSEARTAGDATWLKIKAFPAGFTRRDVYGHPVTATSGSIAAGCSISEFPAQTYGCIGFNSRMAVREFGGTEFCTHDSFTPVGENWAFTLKPVVAANVVPHYIRDEKNREPNKLLSFPLPGEDRWFPVAAMPELGANRMYSMYNVTQTIWADAVNGSDGYDGTSSNFVSGTVGPKKTLAAAVAAVGAGRRAAIYALPGTYGEGTDGVYANKASSPDASQNGTRYRVHVRTTSSGEYVTSVAIIAVGGPEKTFIVGAPDPETGDVGPDAIGGVWLESGIHYVQGFTITGCYGPALSDEWWQRGAAFNGGGSESTHLLDCIVSNNVALAASATGYGTAFRCRILDNLSGRYTGMLTQFGSCIFAGNVRTNETSEAVMYPMLLGSGEFGLYGCTVDDENDPGGYAPMSGGYVGANLVLRHTGNLGAGYVADAEPMVANADARDYRLWSLSPAICSAEISSMPRRAHFNILTDIDGNALEVRDGFLTSGAVHGGARIPSYAINAQGGEISGGAATNRATAAGTVTATAATTRPFLHWEIDGAAQTAGQTAVSFVPSAAEGAATVATAVFGTNWYVNVATGSDSDLGSTPETARATIRSVTTNAVAGDVIHVAPGVYGPAEGADTIEGTALPCRVILPDGVTLEATCGAKETFIVGAASPGADATYGNGPDAIRCVYCRNRATIRGFTITGGHTLQDLKIEGMTMDRRGGAIFSSSTDSRYEDCIISNNASFLGTVYHGKVIRCGLFGNATSYPYDSGSGNPIASGPAGEGCSWYGCVIDGNSGNATVLRPIRIEFCTFGEGNHCYDRNGRRLAQVVYCNSTCQMYNSVILGGQNTTYGTTLYATNCLFRTGITTIGWNQEPYASNRGRCIFADVSEISADAETYMPVNGAYAGIDKGDLSLCDGTLPLDSDRNGGQRIYNGAIDIGAVEFDWRGTYAKALGKGVSVTNAAPEAELAGAAVKIPSGSLGGTLKKGRYEAAFAVTGGGTLSVWCGDTLVTEHTAADGAQKAILAAAESGTPFRFAFAPDAGNPGGYVLISGLSRQGSILISFR